MVKVAGTVAIIGVLVGGHAAAQDAPQIPFAAQSQTQSQAPAQNQTPPQVQTLQVQALAQTVAARRKQLLTFTGILKQAVQNGAESMSQKIRQVTPDAGLVLSGLTEVTYFSAPRLGPVFDVRVPGMRPNAAWALTILMRSPQRIRQPQLPNDRAEVRPTSLAGNASAPDAPPPPAPFVDAALLSDPDAAYTREVKNALIEAMVDYGPNLRIAPGDFLTVVARDSAQPDPLVPSTQTDFHSIAFQISGSDLVELQERRISTDEAKKRVKISED